MPKICPNKVYLWFSLRTVKRLPTCMFGWQAGYRVERCRKAFNWFSLKNIERSQQFLRSEKMLQLRWPNITNNRVFAFDFIYWYNFAKQQNHFVLPISRSAAIAVLKASHIHSHHDGRSVLFCFAFFFTCFFWLFVFVLFVCVYAMPCYAVAHVYTCTHTHTHVISIHQLRLTFIIPYTLMSPSLSRCRSHHISVLSWLPVITNFSIQFTIAVSP